MAAENTGFETGEWQNISLRVRIYHELAHFISRRLYPQNRHAVRDEILADCVGLIAATGGYDAALAKRFLGVEGNRYRKGGRLENYLAEGENRKKDWASEVAALVDRLAEAYASHNMPTAFSFLRCVEEEGLGKNIMEGD